MTWDFISNPFETLTRRRLSAMDALLFDHAQHCHQRATRSPADADFKILHQRALAARAAWNVVYVQWSVTRRTHKGRTFALNQLVAELRSRQVSLWQVMIQRTDLELGVWLKGSEGFETLFPEGRRPFQQGGIESRIAAVTSLASALDRIPSLSGGHQAVHTFLLTLSTARTLQREARVSMAAASTAIEEQRKEVAAMLYRNMARLMEKYADSPATIWSFFDRKLLTKTPGKVPA